MDYDDNDYEGHQNLHLAGEDSSRISSVLRPFALPRFDFDDSLQGHLRFDSLVENEVFLGIPSQEDNHWIEDYSRGGSGIGFSSSAEESCALPRHINVWSEATSSESVEMLLKSVGQEEMVPGEKLMESEPGDQLGNSGQDNQIDDVGEVEGNISSLNHSVGVNVLQTECAVQASDTNDSPFVACDDSKDEILTANYENSDIKLKSSSDNQGETCVLVNESLSTHIEESASVVRTEIGSDKIESSSQNVAVIYKDSVDRDKISDTSFVSSTRETKSLSHSVETQEEGCNKNGLLGKNVIETDSTEIHFPPEVPSEIEYSKEEHSAEICVANVGEASNITQKGEPVSTRTMDFSLSTSIEEQPEGHSIFHELSSISLNREDIDEVGSQDVDPATSTINGDIELKQVSVLVGSEDTLADSHSSLEAPHVSYEVIGNPSDKVDDRNRADGSDDISEDRYSGEKSVIDDTSDAALQKENVEDGDHLGSVQVSTGDTFSMQLDACENDLDVLVCQMDVKKLPLDSSDVVFDGDEKEVPTSSGEGVKVDATTELQPSSSAEAYQALNTEIDDTKLTSSPGEDDELVESNVHNLPSCDTAFMDQSIQIESQTLKQPITSISKNSLESNNLTTVFKTEKGPLLDSGSGEIQTSSQSVFLVESSFIALPEEVHKDLCETMENSSTHSTVQGVGAEAAPAGKAMEAGTGVMLQADSSTIPVTSSTVEMDTSCQVVPPDISCIDLPQSVINNQEPLKNDDAETKEVGTFNFDVSPLDSGKGLQSFPRIQACELSLTGEESSATSGSSLTDPIVVKEVSHTNFLTPPSRGVRGLSERKARRSSSKSGKASIIKANQVIEKSHLRQVEKPEKSSQFLRPLGACQLVKFDSTVKPRGPVSIHAPSLPDLNTSAPPSAFFQQPFTDLQQVQLRAQIFVYGSLIQGSAPDETCMVSAFDGGRSFWEPSWRACVERFHGHKPHGKNTDTPVSLRSGGKALDQISGQGFPQVEAFTSSTGRVSKRPIPSPVNPMISLSSPLWDISTPSAEALPPNSTTRNAVIDYQTVSPFTSYQTPAIRNYISHTTWLSEAPSPVPLLDSSQTSPYDIRTTYHAFPVMAEPVKLTPSKESSLAVSSSTKNVSPARTGTFTTFSGGPSLDFKKLKVSSEQTADTKDRKMKKSFSGVEDAVQVSVVATLADSVSAPVVASQLSNKVPAVEALSQFSFMARNQVDQILTPVISNQYSTSVAAGNPSDFVRGTTDHFSSMASPSVTGDQYLNMDKHKRAMNIEDISKVEEAKLQAQEAAVHAAAAVSECEGMWSQLGQQASSGLTTDAQSKLACAAIAIAAAASVAKAAAAAAKIALTAALQAKQMADEAVTDPTGRNAVLFSNSMDMVNESPVSILRGGDRPIAPSLAISTAREAARKRIEAASDATRHAENLDAIVKAAELAAEAVSHAGKIVSMREPFSLSELVESGPSNYWKGSHVDALPGLKSSDKNKNKFITTDAGEVPEDNISQHEEPDKDMHFTSDGVSPTWELSRHVVDDNVAVEENIAASGKHWKNFKLQKDKRVSNSANIGSGSSSYDALSSIKEGSRVEVLKDHDGSKAWFSASVLNLKDGEALVSYTELQSDEGSEQLKEWISIEAKDGEAPKVRTPHHMIDIQFEGTRKRPRSAVTDYTWCVGDKVDAWVQDCWREGVISEDNKKEATTLSVRFAEKEETLLVKVWHLRPTLIWHDGQWIEWCRPGHDPISQGDTPKEKRPKLGSSSSSFEDKGKADVAKNMDFADIGKNQLPRLPLSASEKIFSIGSSAREEMVRTMRPGVEKQGSKVVFGVPKPGKKRKFMEVSKHYVSDRVLKTNAPNDSVKSAKLWAPHGFESRGVKNNSLKLDLKDKQLPVSKPRLIKSGKPPSVPSRNLVRKDGSTSSRPNARGVMSDIEKGSTSNDENESGEQSTGEFGSYSNTEETSGGSMVFSSQAIPKDNRKKTITRNIKPGPLNRGKLAPASVKSAKNESSEKSISEVSEPRRSNRRIQPTSRLLEGLQSSLLISKIPSSSHSKGGARGSNNNRG